MSYKDQQELARQKMKPRIVPEDEWDDHDREFMSKGTGYNRKYRRRKLRDSNYTKKRGFKGHKNNPHQVSGFKLGMNHERYLARRKIREELQNA